MCWQYVAGDGNHAVFPVNNSHSDIPANVNLYHAALDPPGASLAFSTPFGGSSSNFIGHMAVDCTGNAYLTGGTTSADFPVTSSVFQINLGRRA